MTSQEISFNIGQNDLTQSRILQLQILAKKRKILEEFYMKNLDEQNKKIEKESFELIKSKLKVLQFFDNLNNSNPEAQEDQNQQDKKQKKKEKFLERNENEPPTKFVKYELLPNESSLSDTSVYVKAIFNYIRTDQNLIYKLLTMRNMTKNDRVILASFVTNFLYENMLNYSLIDDEYLLILYRTLKLEISNLEFSNKPLQFLSPTYINSYLFLSLNNKNFIKAYFKKIITPILEKMERGENSKIILFPPEQINRIFDEENRGKNQTQSQKEIESSLKRNNVPNSRDSISDLRISSISRDGGSWYADIYDSGSYFSQASDGELTESILDMDLFREKLSELLSKETNQDMKDYLIQKFINCRKKETLYSSKKLQQKINSLTHKDKITTSYNLSFSFAKGVVKILIDNLEKYIEVVPYPVKCLCKIIDELIKIKFPKIYKFERLGFINQFFFEKLLKPIFEVPDLKCGFSEVFLSNITTQNIKIVEFVLSKLFSASFFNEVDNTSYTPFNLLFIELMPRLMKMFDTILQVELPPIIKKLLHKEDGTFKVLEEEKIPYDYFKENPNEKIRHVSVCYCVEDIEVIMNLIKKNPDQLLRPYANDERCKAYYKACSKFIPSNNSLDDESSSEYFKFLEKSKIGYEIYQKKVDIQEKPKKISRRESRECSVSLNSASIIAIREMLKDNPNAIQMKPQEDQWDGLIKRYFLAQKLELETEFGNFVTPKDKPYFSLEGKKKKALQINDREKYNILEIKKNILEFLLKYQDITQVEIKDCKTTLEILSKLIRLAEVDYYLMNESYSLEWNYLSICQCIESLGVDHPYIKNDFDKIYCELLEELQTSTNHLHLDPFLSVLDRFRYSNAEKFEIDDYYEKIKRTERNKYIQQFAEKFPIEVYLTFSDSGGKEKSLKIVDKSIDCMNELDSFLFDKKKHDGVRCKNILHFIKKFPDIFKNQKLKGEPFEIEKSLDYPDQIKNYLSLVKQHLESDLKQKQTQTPITQEELNLYFEEMSMYIMKRLYPKLYPKDPNMLDVKIQQKCEYLSWIEPKHFEKIEFIDNLDYYIAEIKKALLNLDNEKSPIGKANLFLEINSFCNKITKHTQNIKEVTIDDTYDLILYCIIKSRPKRLSSNIQYVQLYLEKNVQKGCSGLGYTIIEGASKMILNLNQLKHVSEKEFQQ